MTTKAVAKKEEKAVVQWKGEQITVSFHDVKTLICPLATDQETAVFLKTCQSLQLNPFTSEIYLIKYSERDKAATVIAIDSYLKAGEANPQFDGFLSGIILKEPTGQMEYREGAFLLDEEREKLVGGWARVYRKDRSRPFYVAVNKAECIRYTREGNPTQFWTPNKQPSMLRKVALKRALVEAFPSLFAGATSNVDYEMLPEEVKEVLPEPRGETLEGEFPRAYERNGKAYWKLWWARQKGKGLSTDDVHRILQINSLKDDWLDQGRTLEEAEGVINSALESGSFEHVPEGTPAADEKMGARAPKVKPGQAEWHDFWTYTERLGLTRDQVYELLGVQSVVDWTDQGKTLDEAIKTISEKLTQGSNTSAAPTRKVASKAERDPATIKTINDF